MRHFICIVGLFLLLTFPATLFSWNIEILDEDVGSSSSISIDGQDKPFIAYNLGTGYRILYKEGDQWLELTAPDSIRSLREFIDMEVDADGGVHVVFDAYDEEFNSDVWHDMWDGESWEITPIVMGWQPSLALNPNQFPYVSYTVTDGLAFGSRVGVSWNLEEVDTLVTGWESCVVSDSQENPHISYYAFREDQQPVLKYAMRDSTGWHDETVDESGDRGHMNALALDSKDNPHIAYIAWFFDIDPDSLEVWYTYKEGNEWHLEVVDKWDGIEPIGWFWQGQISLAVDVNDVPHISYRNEDRLYYARRDPWTGEWSKEMVDATWGTGRYTSLAIDSNGFPHISFSVRSGGTRYATTRPTSISDDKSGSISLPKTFSLSQNYPNPFNPSTTIQYDIPVESGTVPVEINIYDVRGHLVRKLVNQEKEPGRYLVHWDGRDSTGHRVVSGIYLYRMEIDCDLISTKKMVLLK
jgi:hypothetical protein